VGYEESDLDPCAWVKWTHEGDTKVLQSIILVQTDDLIGWSQVTGDLIKDLNDLHFTMGKTVILEHVGDAAVFAGIMITLTHEGLTLDVNRTIELKVHSTWPRDVHVPLLKYLKCHPPVLKYPKCVLGQTVGVHVWVDASWASKRDQFQSVQGFWISLGSPAQPNHQLHLPPTIPRSPGRPSFSASR